MGLAKRWFYAYTKGAAVFFAITCAVAFAEFAHERLLFEHGEITSHVHGKKLFVGVAVGVVVCWVLLAIVVVVFR